MQAETTCLQDMFQWPERIIGAMLPEQLKMIVHLLKDVGIAYRTYYSGMDVFTQSLTMFLQCLSSSAWPGVGHVNHEIAELACS